MSKYLTSKRFVVQLIIVFVIFTLGSTLLLGVPALLLLERQTNHQIEALVDQSIRTTIALFDNQIIRLDNLARLLAERPTLTMMVNEDGSPHELSQYLLDFLENSELDAVLICQKEMLLASIGDVFDLNICSDEIDHVSDVFSEDVLLLSTATLEGSSDNNTRIIVGQRVSTVLNSFNEQTGMAYWLVTDSETLVSTINGLENARALIESFEEDYQTFESPMGVFMMGSIKLESSQGFRLFGLLDIGESLAQTRQVREWVMIGLFVVSLFGAGVAVLVSRRISKPLDQLAEAAASLREGDLTTPLTTPSEMWEISQLSNALEDVRVSLKHSLDQLQKEKLWIESLMNAMVEGLITIDDQARITFASRPIENIFNADLTSLLGKHLDDLFVPIGDEVLFSQQIPDQNQVRRIPVQLHDREALLSVSTTTFVPADAGNASMALMIRDVTNEEHIHRLLGEFMANITHEFRTPLSALAASVELLLDELPELSMDEMRQLIEALNIGIIDLQSLIDNLIEASSIEAGRFKVNPHKVELSAILSDALKTAKPLLRKKGLALHMSKPIPSFLVMADRRRTVQVLINLLSNAIKHSPEGGALSLQILMMENEVLLKIQDEGQGVMPDFQEKIFKRFMSTDINQDLATAGMGLGLSVVKAVVEAQGGKGGFSK